jgi:hypothetical protein
MALVRLAWLGSVDATGSSRQEEYRKRGANASGYVDKLLLFPHSFSEPGFAGICGIF